MIFGFLQKYWRRNSFARYIPRQVLKDVASGNLANADSENLKPSEIQCILVAVRGETLEIISENVGKVTEIADQHNSIIVTLVSSLIVITYGAIPVKSNDEPTITGDRFMLVEALAKALGSDIKIVHGVEAGVCGFLGTNSRMQFSFIVPNFMDNLGTLASLNFGETQEV